MTNMIWKLNLRSKDEQHINNNQDYGDILDDYQIRGIHDMPCIMYIHRSHFGSDLIRTGRAHLPKNSNHGGLEDGGGVRYGITGQPGPLRRRDEKGAQKKEQRDLGNQSRGED
eukprot:16450579-Heterocapsa_arctica.AAC.1